MPSFTYVYVLRSKADTDQYYTGCTADLETRLHDHNRGHVPHTSKSCPWEVEIAMAFRDAAKARQFESYLKSGSGREFSRRHFR
jgi:putative endonuclease